jgi:thioesterase domain-containing protein
VVNSYGLTETTIDSTYFDVPPTDSQEDTQVPIGRPFPGTRAYVLDRWGQPVPKGLIGELYIGGCGVARGYVADPRQTAQKFVPDPYGVPGSRIYATGDLARWCEEGVVELLGRRDGQVKVRGFRVELAEVEEAIRSFPGVVEAAVVARKDGIDGHRLIGCIVGDGEQTPGVDTIRRHLRDRLPGPMIPATMKIIKALPRTPSGKIDRQSLAEALPDTGTTSEGHVPPRDELETELVSFWEDLLQTRPIGVTDDFFDLGGHSLLVVRLAARIRERWGRSLALSDLLLGSTIEELAARLRGVIPSHAASSLIPLKSSGPGHPLFLVHPIGGGVFCYNDLARRLDGSRAVFGLQSRGLDDDAAPETDLVRMASRYVDAIVAQFPEGPYYLGGWSMGGVVAFEMATQLSAAGREVSLVFLIDCSPPTPRAAHGAVDRASLEAFAADLARTTGLPAGTSLEHIRKLAPDLVQDRKLELAVLGHDFAPDLDSERVQRLYAVYRANRLALDGYQPGAYSGRLILMRTQSSWTTFQRDPTRGWAKLADRDITTFHVPGDHYSILQLPAVERLAEILKGEIEDLERAEEKNHLR